MDSTIQEIIPFVARLGQASVVSHDYEQVHQHTCIVWPVGFGWILCTGDIKGTLVTGELPSSIICLVIVPIIVAMELLGQ